MPRIRQRIVVCDCFDCVEQITDPTNASISAANEAAARQEPPPKCLLFICSGFLGSSAVGSQTSILDAQQWPHLNRVAQQGGQGFVGSRVAACSDSSGEVAQLLGVYEEVARSKSTGALQPHSLPSLSSRFKGMQAALASNIQQVRELGAACGLRPSAVLDLTAGSAGLTEGEAGEGAPAAGRPATWLPSPQTAVEQILRELGVSGTPASAGGEGAHAGGESAGGVNSKNTTAMQGDDASVAPAGRAEGEEEEQEELDMLIVHVEAPSSHEGGSQGAASSDEGYERCLEAVEWLDGCLRDLNQVAAVRDTVLLCVIMSTLGQPHNASLHPGGSALNPGSTIMSVEEPGTADEAHAVTVSRPPQSFQSRTGQAVKVALDAPLLAVRKLPGVIRSDRAQKFSVEECARRGGLGAVLLDHLVPEFAYKLGRAPKYGA